MTGGGVTGVLRADPVGWRALLRRGGYPVLLFGGTAACGVAITAGLAPGTATAVVTVLGALALIGLERAVPFAGHWVPSARTVAVDLRHTLVTVLVAAASRGLTVTVAAGAAGWLAGMWGGALWPVALPLPIRVGLGVLVADLGAWATHRWLHASPLGWRVHAVHHTSEGLSLFAASRTHPLNAMAILSAEMVPLVALGADPATIAMLTAFKGLNGQIQHANVDLRCGALNAVLNTCEVHRWHHSVDRGHASANFGNATVVWDRLFGTWFFPHAAPAHPLGLDGHDVPERWSTHLLLPWTLDRWRRR